MLVPMKAILAAADKYRYGQGAFNMNSVGQIEAAVRIHELLHSGAILQGAEASNAFMGGELDFMHGTIEAKKVGAKRIGDAVKRYGENSPVPIALHLDHGKSIESVKACIDGGYTSVMIDGSSLPYEQNVELTREVVKLAHPYGVTVEGELGVLAGVEDHVFSATSTYTNPMQAVDFFKKTGCDALAISYGTCHGANKGKDTKIRREIAIATKECMLHEGIDGYLVSHGSSTVPQEYVQGINALGGQLENAIINLVMNARDAMDGQTGTIKIRTWNQRVTRSDGRKQDMVMLEVADQGSGMSQEVKAQVFEPFFTTKQTGSGSGLGLSMVYGFVRQSGGRVEIESAPGQGTTVRLQLPRAVVPVQVPVEPIAEHPATRGEKLVLVLEDEADVRQTLCEQLHLLGYLTLEAANGEQAMHMLAASAEIDILVSDLMLPGGLSGADVVNHALKHYPQLNILLISGQDLRPAHNPALPDVALLRKPFTRGELAQALRHSCN